MHSGIKSTGCTTRPGSIRLLQRLPPRQDSEAHATAGIAVSTAGEQIRGTFRRRWTDAHDIGRDRPHRGSSVGRQVGRSIDRWMEGQVVLLSDESMNIMKY